MNNFGKTISRRQLIKSLGAMGLLSSMSGQRLLASTTNAPVRVLLVALQHGWGISGGSNRFMSGTETNFSFPNGLHPFNEPDVKKHATVIDGLLTLGEYGNNHDLSYADMFTSGVPVGVKGSSFDSKMAYSVKPSLDYLLQQNSGLETFRFSAGYRSWGAQYHPLCWDENQNVLPFHTKASSAYNSIFKDLTEVPNNGSVNPDAAFASRILGSLKTLSERERYALLNSNEKSKLTQYLASVSAFEAKNGPQMGYGGSIRLTDTPTSSQSNLQDLPYYLDMIKVGFANNLTTSAVLGIGDIENIADFHHSHAHSNSSVYWDSRARYAQMIADFVRELDGIQDFDGNSLLDNTIIVLTGEVGDGMHNVLDKGHILLGGGSGNISTGRYINLPVITIAETRALKREDLNGNLVQQALWSGPASIRTNADLMRQVGNIAGLNLAEFGFSSQNKGTIPLKI